MANLSLQFVLELVDRLSGPARDAARSLDGFKEAADGLNGAGGDLQAKGWVEASRAVGQAADAVKGYEAATIGAASANDNVASPWLEAGRAIVAAMQATGEYEGAVSSATARGEALAGVWARAEEQINYATAAVGRFDEAEARGGGGGGGGGGGYSGRRGGGVHGGGEHGGWGETLKTAGELGLMMEAPRAIEGIVHAGAGIQGEEINQKIAGMTADQIAEAHDRAIGYASTYKLFGIAEIGKQIREGRTVFTSDADAKELMPDIMKLATLQEKTRRGSGMESAYQFTRAIEEAGISKDVGRAHQFYDDAAKAVNFFGGTVTGEDYQLAFNRAGIYGRQYDRNFTKYILPHLLQTFHGDVTGTMLGTFGQMIVGGHMSGKEIATLEKLGMIDKRFVTKRDKKGRAAEIDPGGVVGTQLAEHDPFEFAKLLIGKMRAKDLSEDQQVDLLTTIFGNRNAAKALFTLSHDDAQLNRTREGIDNPENKGLEAFKDVSGDAASAFSELKTALENLYGVASEPMMGSIAWGLDKLAGGISTITGALAGDKITGTMLTLSTIGGALYGGLKAFTGLGGAVGSWLGVATAAEVEVTALGTAAEAASVGLSAMIGPLGLLVGTLYELSAQSALGKWARNEESQLNAWSKDHFKWSNPTHEYDWNDPAQRETATRQEYARQADQHPIIRGERDMETAHGQALGEIAARANEAAAAFQKLFEKGSGTIAPNVDARAVDALESKMMRIVALMNQINGGGLSYSPAAGRSSSLHDGVEHSGRY